jgi:hypothetical protein
VIKVGLNAIKPVKDIRRMKGKSTFIVNFSGLHKTEPKVYVANVETEIKSKI